MAKNKDTTTISSPVVNGDNQDAKATPTAVAETRARSATRAQVHPSLSDQLVAGVADTVNVVRRVLPSRLPAYLGAGALLVVGVIEPPVALAGGLAYEALRRWRPSPSRTS